jgi:hypothetical protein
MDDPDIDARQFLFRTMHEPSLDLAVRMDAADKLLQLGLGNYREEEVHITIRGGIEHPLSRRRAELRVVDPAYWDIKHAQRQ